MNLGIFLGIGESLKQMEKSGQKDRFINLYLKKYSKNFDRVYLFTYDNDFESLPKNVIIVPKKSSIHRYLYSFAIPVVNRKQVNDCDIIRGFGLTSIVPSLLTSKPFIFNFPYNYVDFLKIEKKYFLIPIYYVLEKIAFVRSKLVLVATKQKLKTLTGQKYIYLPNGVDMSLFKRANKLGEGIVFVGRLEKQKNLFFLIEAVSRLPDKLKSITFIGSGSREKTLIEHAAKKKVSLNILPPVSNLKLPAALSKFSIFAMTSLAEGSPKVILEAMSIGLVPIVTDFSTAGEIITNGQNGFITDYDIQKYSSTLKTLLTDKNLKSRVSLRTTKSILDKFNIYKILEKEIDILKNTAQGNVISKKNYENS